MLRHLPPQCTHLVSQKNPKRLETTVLDPIAFLLHALTDEQYAMFAPLVNIYPSNNKPWIRVLMLYYPDLTVCSSKTSETFEKLNLCWLIVFRNIEFRPSAIGLHNFIARKPAILPRQPRNSTMWLWLHPKYAKVDVLTKEIRNRNSNLQWPRYKYPLFLTV